MIYGDVFFDKRDKFSLLTFDDGLKEHVTHIGPYLSAKGIKGIFSVCNNTVFKKIPTIAQTLHFGTAFYGIRKFSEEITDFIDDDRVKKQYLDLLNFNNRANIYTLNTKIKAYFNRQSDHTISSRIMVNFWKNKLEKEAGIIFDQIYMNEDDLKALLEMGHTIGFHTATHSVINDLSFNDNLYKNEITDPKKEIENRLGIKINTFTYPFGSKNDLLSTDKNIKRLKNAGVEYILTTFFGDNKKFDNDRIGRYPSQCTDSVTDLAANLWSYEISNYYK